MTNSKFTIKGYARFYRSLPRFYQGIDDAHALKFTYRLHLATNSAYRHRNPDKGIAEYSEKEFYPLILQQKAKPYRTEIQLYRALESLAQSLSVKMQNDTLAILKTELKDLMCDLETRFYKAFGMKITDSRTVYWQCAKGLVANRDEPFVCLYDE